MVGILGAFAAFLRRRPEDIDALNSTITRLRTQLAEVDGRLTEIRTVLYRLRDRYDALWSYTMKLRQRLTDAGHEPPPVPEEARNHDQ